MRRDMCFVLLPPSFVLIDSTCILSCAIIWIVHAFFHVLLYGSISQLNKSNEELKMKQWCLYFHISFPFFVLFFVCLFVCLFVFQDYASKAEMYLELLSFIFGGPK